MMLGINANIVVHPVNLVKGGSKMTSDQCSKLFEEVFDSSCGGCVRMCECGITYFDTSNLYGWEEGELKELKKKAKEHPDKYIAIADCAVGTMEINGREIVIGCTCDLARRYEKFIISHARQLAEYLNRRADALKKAADSMRVGT